MLYNKRNYAKFKCVQSQPSPLQGENGNKNHQTWNFGNSNSLFFELISFMINEVTR